jgi:hypothetical protein
MSKGRLRAGHPEGTEPIAAIPSLDQLAAAPERVAQLPRQALLEARRAAQRLVADLDMALALATPQAPPVAPQDGQEDRLLTTAEAAILLGRTKRWMRKYGRHLPGRVEFGPEFGPKSIGYQRAALTRFVKQRTAK